MEDTQTQASWLLVSLPSHRLLSILSGRRLPHSASKEDQLPRVSVSNYETLSLEIKEETSAE